ncbi:hypothetical protein [Cupriavidus basilensis]|uniref:hypothetical protein n=1 Tax=Cupriavidus basilensis TaxID=68895 RepID=UPI0023E7DED5|nr:hypothetical protein [Cupriavidus basilensis]
MGGFHFVGTVPFVGFAGFEPISGGEAVVTADGRRVHPRLCGFGDARKYDEGLFFRPGFVDCVMTAITVTPHFGSAHTKNSAAFTAALDV